MQREPRSASVLATAAIVVAASLAVMGIGTETAAQAGCEGADAHAVTYAQGYVGLVQYTGTQDGVNCYIADRLDGAGPGDSIRAQLYFVSRRGDLVPALESAAARGADVTLITEYRSENDGTAHRANLVSLADAGVTVERCYYGCDYNADATDTNAINHNKMFLLDIGGARSIIQSSANSIESGRQNFEQAVLLNGDHYDEIWAFVDDVWADDACYATEFPMTPVVQPQCSLQNGNGGYESEYQGTVGVMTPSPTTYDAQLDWISRMTSAPGCRLDVAMGHFSNFSRGKALADAMRELAARGCQVTVVYGGKRSLALEERASAAATATQSPIDITHRARVHAKFMLFDGRYNGELKKYVWQGSANFTNGSLSHDDELIVRTSQHGVYDEMLDYFGDVSIRDGYQAISPTRVLDTRDEDRPAAGTTVTIDMGLASVPPDAEAVVVNVASVQASDSGFVTAWNCQGVPTDTSFLNHAAGSVTSGSTTIGLSPNDQACLRPSAEGDLVVDVVGFYRSAFTPDQRRLDDTRLGGGTAVPAGVPHVVDLPGASVGELVSLTVTAVQPAGPGHLKAWNCDDGAAPTDTSNSNFAANAVVANAVTIEAGPSRQLCVQSTVDVDLVVDLVGRQAAGTGATMITPRRALEATPRHSSGSLIDVPLYDDAPGAPRIVPRYSGAAIANIAIVNPSHDGYANVSHCDRSELGTSSINFRSGVTVAAQVVVELGRGDDPLLELCVDLRMARPHGETGVIIDVFGYHD